MFAKLYYWASRLLCRRVRMDMDVSLPIIRYANSQNRIITAHVTEKHSLLESGWYTCYKISFPVSAGVVSYLANTRRINAEVGFFRASQPEAGDAVLFGLPAGLSGNRYAGMVFDGRRWKALELPPAVLDFWFDREGRGSILKQTNEIWRLQPDTAIGLHTDTMLDWFAGRITYGELLQHYQLGMIEQERYQQCELLEKALAQVRAHRGECHSRRFGDAEALLQQALLRRASN